MSVSIDTTGEVWFTWRRRDWAEAVQMGARIAQISECGTAIYFPAGWEPFALRTQRRPQGRGALINIIVGYRKIAEEVPAIDLRLAAEIYSQIDEMVTRDCPGPAPAPSPV